MVSFTTRLSSAVGDKTARPMDKALGLRTVEDLLRHYPRRYAEIGSPTDLSGLNVGQYATVLADVVDARVVPFRNDRRRSRTEVVVTDGREQLSLTFFQQPYLAKKLTHGRTGLFSGEVGSFNGRLQLTNPDFELLESEGDVSASRLARGVLPIYAATAKLTSWSIERSVAMCLDTLESVPDPMPESLRTRRRFEPAREAFESIHRPRSVADAMRARDRFRFEEAFVMQTVFAQRRHALEQLRSATRAGVEGGLRDRFAAALPFTLTGGQRAVADEIADDLARSRPMHRLLQGEVGSGKTIVALLAMLQVVDAGGQAALLAPTEVLAAQHHRSITAQLGDLAKGGMLGGAEGATRVRLLTGSMGAKARKESLLDAASGEAGIVIGTHALIQDHVQFAELGLLVVDEQHRFGVEQRAALVDRAEVTPHVLVMTATPIPRTIAMTVFGDLEVSTLTELPAGRQPIQTTVVPAAARPAWMQRAWERVREEVAKGRQAYVVVSRIGAEAAQETSREETANETRSLTELYDELRAGPLEGLRVGALHGRMPAEVKDAAMRAFAGGDVDVLVATTVVEVGVDVPNATVMVVMDADRFGISQLHQLRGRVGRGSEAGLCLLVTDTDPDSPSAERLAAVASTTDGFELSRLDVELRREGDVLGARQSGVRSSLKLLSVVRDGDVIEQAREAAHAVVAADPELASHPDLVAAIRALEDTEQADYLERT
jgi:ATP-dependent DNA helicase RecG